MKKHNPFISIVIPIYNCEKYLKECLDSCFDQDVDQDEYELVCVNDGSTDGCPIILEEYAKKHGNIVIVNQPNGGLVAAEKSGVSAASGDYIWFVDGDDMIKPNCLSVLKALAKNQYDIIGFKGYNFYGSLSKEKASSIINDGSDAITSICCKAFHIFSSSIIKEGRCRFYTELQYGEDEHLYCFLNENARSICETDYVFYFYRQHQSSIMGQLTSKDAIIRRMEDTIFSMVILKDKILSGEFKKPFSLTLLQGRYYTAKGCILALNKKEGDHYLKRMSDEGLFDAKLKEKLIIPDYKVFRSEIKKRQKFISKRNFINKTKKLIPRPVFEVMKKALHKNKR